MRTGLAAFTIVVASIFAGSAFAQNATPVSGTYKFDPEHSAISFEYDHNNRTSESFGLVRGIEGTIVLTAEDPENSMVEASFPLSNIVTIAPGLDKHIRSKDFFNSSDGSSKITFTSTKVELEDGDEAEVTGDLTINGVTKPVTLQVEFNNYGENPITKAITVGFNADTTIKRSDFNLGKFVPVVGNEIEINISVEAGASN